MSKHKFLIILNIILLILVIGLSLHLFVFNRNQSFKITRPYYAVYLRTGDLYFGYLNKFFSRYTLTNVYLLQRDQNGGYSLQKFEQSAYQPEDKLILNKENIVWISPIQKNSPLMSILEGKQAPVSNNPTPVPQETTTTSSSTSTTIKSTNK